MSKEVNVSQEVFSQIDDIDAQIKALQMQKKIVVVEVQKKFSPEEIAENANRYKADLEAIDIKISDTQKVIASLKEDKKLIVEKAKKMLSLANIKINATPRESKIMQIEIVNGESIKVQRDDAGLDITLQVKGNAYWYQELKEQTEGSENMTDGAIRSMLHKCSCIVKETFGEKFPK